MTETVSSYSIEPQWYAIRTKPMQESVAKINYQRQGYHVYLPQLSSIVRHARRTTEKLVAFFPGYLFLHLAPAECNWTAIASTRGSQGALRFGDTYVPIPDWVIADLKAREDSSTCAIPLTEVMKKQLVPGCIVTVNMAGGEIVQGVVYSSRGSENVEVLMSILGRQVKASVALARIGSA